MEIGGFQKSSFLDYPGKIAAIIFTQGCNFHCGYCHNPELLPIKGVSSFDETSVLEFLKNRQGLLEGVVISGGEPCLQYDIVDFVSKIKSMNFCVKLDTNGTFFDVLEELLNKNLIDYIAMDIKSPFGKYNAITCAKIPTEKIKKSIKLIKNSGIDYEFRTTVLKSQLLMNDFEKIGNMICGAKKYYLQKFVSSKNLKEKYSENDTYSDEDFEIIAQNLKKYVEYVGIR